jgi:regulator of RNase E activity RraA
VTVGSVSIEPGDWVVGDEDGVVVVPHAMADEVLLEAEQKAATESEIRLAVRDGLLPLEAFERYGTF